MSEHTMNTEQWEARRAELLEDFKRCRDKSSAALKAYTDHCMTQPVEPAPEPAPVTGYQPTSGGPPPKLSKPYGGTGERRGRGRR